MRSTQLTLEVDDSSLQLRPPLRRVPSILIVFSSSLWSNVALEGVLGRLRRGGVDRAVREDLLHRVNSMDAVEVHDSLKVKITWYELLIDPKEHNMISFIARVCFRSWKLTKWTWCKHWSSSRRWSCSPYTELVRNRKQFSPGQAFYWRENAYIKTFHYKDG
jgi:hypothetical protein